MMNAIQIKDKRGLSYLINQEVLKVGRAIDNDIVLKDLSISRYHIAIQPVDDGIVVFNTGSDAGFYLNGQWHLDSAIARNGDVIRIGHEEFFVNVQLSNANDFAYSPVSEGSRSSSLDVNSKNKKIRTIAVALIAALLIGMLLSPDDAKVEAPAGPIKDSPTIGLPNDSFTELDVERRGPQELTADDLYTRGMREISNNNQIRAIMYFQQALVEDPSLVKARKELADAETALKNRVTKLVEDSEKNYQDGRLVLSRAQANHALDLMSEQIPGFSFQVQQKQRTLASQKLPVLSREQIYLDLPCKQTPDEKLCERAKEILKRSRLKLGEENVLK
jgi:pSer/pThr/pTyr-binding forkhead associated (FHA) protein